MATIETEVEIDIFEYLEELSDNQIEAEYLRRKCGGDSELKTDPERAQAIEMLLGGTCSIADQSKMETLLEMRRNLDYGQIDAIRRHLPELAMLIEIADRIGMPELKKLYAKTQTA